MNRIIVSTAGYEQLRSKLHAVTIRFDIVRAESRQAFELAGDGWHDNPSLNALQQQEAELTKQIAELTRLVVDARVLDICDGSRPVDVIRYGSIVRLESREAAAAQLWEIAGFDESDMAKKKLAYSSPLGRRLLGRREGDEIECPNGECMAVAALYGSWDDCATSCGRVGNRRGAT